MRARHSGTSEQRVAGSLLLAHPALQESTFRHTVILMSSHDDQGAMGVVLNRPLGRRLGELNGEFALGALAGVPVYRGGPVAETQLVLAAWETRDDGFRLHFGIEPVKAAQCLDEAMHVRAFLGYAGWSGGQLENELKRNTWVISDIPENLVNQPQDESLWRSILGAKGADWRLLADEPDEPDRN
ncbi:MAG: YqgE/AlgH family protein [Opitutales bacterium]